MHNLYIIVPIQSNLSSNCAEKGVPRSRPNAEVHNKCSNRNDIQRYNNEVYKDSKTFAMDVNGNDLCCMCTNHNEVYTSEVDSHPCMLVWNTSYLVKDMNLAKQIKCF